MKFQAGNTISFVQATGHLGTGNLSIPSGNPSLLSDTIANNAALMKFNQKLTSANTTFQGGVFLGELAETLHGIKNPAQSLRKLVDLWRFRAYKYRRVWSLENERREGLLHLSDFHKTLSGLWLESSFHWRPLLKDIDDGCKALAELSTGEALVGDRITAVGKSQVVTSNLTGAEGHSIAIWRYNEIASSDVYVIYRGAVRVQPRDNLLMAPELLGFNPGSFLPTAWEITPYSFLIDYFTNIDDIISGWSHGTGDLSWCNRTVRKSYVVKRDSYSNTKLVNSVRSPLEPPWNFSHSPASVVIEKTAVNRSTYSGTLTPTFEWDIPGFRSKKWLNIAALIAGRTDDRSFKFGD
jgi:hypothetical protein